jgi:hypothetical protein
MTLFRGPIYKLFRDPDWPMGLRVNKRDIADGVPEDERNCAMALAARRMPGVVGAWFKRTMAYIEYADHIDRYELPAGTRAAIIGFDSLKGIAIDGTYFLLPPRPSATIAAIAAKNERRRLRRVAGIKPVARKVPRGPDILKALGVRNGSGRMPVKRVA